MNSRKPSVRAFLLATGGPESNSPLENEGSQECTRIEKILALWEENLKDPIVALDKALKCVEVQC